MRRLSYCLLWLISALLANTAARADMEVWHRSPLDFGNYRYEYDIEVMRLALEKTRATYGGYQLHEMPPTNFARMVYALRSNTYPNMLLETTYDTKLDDSGELTYIAFPIELGILGYRVCFVNPNIKEQVKQATTLADLRPYTMGQGDGWADIDILRHNGFTVAEVGNYPSLFKMVAGGRFDLLCRGVNELMMEYDQYQHIGHLTYDDSFALVYRLPRFFYLNKNNGALKQRIEEGLKIAYADGSLLALWRNQNLKSIQFTQLPKRKIFYLENPAVSDLPREYERYLIDPMTLK